MTALKVSFVTGYHFSGKEDAANFVAFGVLLDMSRSQERLERNVSSGCVSPIYKCRRLRQGDKHMPVCFRMLFESTFVCFTLRCLVRMCVFQ